MIEQLRLPGYFPRRALGVSLQPWAVPSKDLSRLDTRFCYGGLKTSYMFLLKLEGENDRNIVTRIFIGSYGIGASISVIHGAAPRSDLIGQL
jgi:hypothetical protein